MEDDDDILLPELSDSDEDDAGKESRSKRKVVVSLDLGTTYTGYAYSFTNDWTKIYTSSYHGEELVSQKAPSALLLNPDQSFYKFGFEAEIEYAVLSEDEKQQEYYFFPRFRSFLNPEVPERLTKKTVFSDENGKKCSALKIFSIVINHLLTTVLDDANKKTRENIKIKDIDLFITVPVLLDDTARMLLIEASKASKVESGQLKIVLESEAASVYCQYQHLEDRTATSKELFKDNLIPGFRYMVVDLGGGSADFSVNEYASDHSMRHVIESTAVRWGGAKVDEAYWQLWCDLLGAKTMKRFKEEHMEDYLSFLRSFEVQKRAGPLAASENLYIRIPLSLAEILEDVGGAAQAISRSKYKGIISFDQKSYKCKVPIAEFEKLFEETCEHIASHLKKVWEEIKGKSPVDTVLLVGGFADCYIIKNKIKEDMTAQKKTLILPTEPGSAVLKGAVYMGHVSDAVTTRFSSYSFGIQNWPSFDPGKHPADRKTTVDKQERCREVFAKFLTKGDKISPKHRKTFILEVLKPDEDKLECGIYMSPDKDPKYTDEKGVVKVGSVIIDLPKVEKGTPIEIEEEINILDTGVRVVATELQKFSEFSEVFDLLSVEA